MPRIISEPLTPFAPSSRWLGVAGLLLGAIAVAAVRFGGIPPFNGFVLLAGAILCGGLALVCALAALGVIWRFGGPGLGQAMKGLGLGLAVLAAPAYFGVLAVTLPMLNDVTTDLADPPSFGRTRAAVDARKGHIPAEYTGQTALDQQEYYPALRPVLLDQSVEDTMALALRAATNLGWTVIDSTPPSGRTNVGRIEAVVRTGLFGLTDDVTVRIRPGVNETRIDVRSASRVGRHDFGLNAARIVDFQREIELLSSQR